MHVPAAYNGTYGRNKRQSLRRLACLHGCFDGRETSADTAGLVADLPVGQFGATMTFAAEESTDRRTEMGIGRVAVTSGSGKAGIAVVRDLRANGFEVLNIDIAASSNPDDPTLVVDLTDLGQTIEALTGFDAIVHLAAVPAPNVVTDGETFRTNTISTYNVFSAAAQHRVERVVWASSETLIGLPFVREQPRYAPIDEDHPPSP
jgi:hypothetical protein